MLIIGVLLIVLIILLIGNDHPNQGISLCPKDHMKLSYGLFLVFVATFFISTISLAAIVWGA